MNEQNKAIADDRRRQWEQEEQAIRARLKAAGTHQVETLAARSGLEFLQAIFSGELPHPPIGETLNFIPVLAEPGRVIFQGTPPAAHYTPLGAVHGGGAATLLDSCVGSAGQSMLPRGKGDTTLGLKVNY
ncbi:MAG: PaaI family thioesterase, partial [Ectothiorhodospiraceae bacterium]|nr:PaaI family thioesterase [Ectothiorhodospiraceae bacterium]